MKNFKLNYLAFSLVVATLSSCALDDTLKDAEKTETASSDTFSFDEEIHNYEVDGKLVYDRKLITNAAKEAWHVLYDYPNNRVAISTTPKEFEKYKSSHPEFKAIYEEKPVEPVEETNNAADNQIQNLFAAIPVETATLDDATMKQDVQTTRAGTITINRAFDVAYHGSENDTNDLVLHLVQRERGVVSYYNIDLYTNSDTTNSTPFHSATTNNSNNFKMGLGRSPLRSFLDNAADRPRISSKIINHFYGRKTLTLYRGVNYTGVSRTIRINGNSRYTPTQGSLKFAGRGALSIKVTNG
jgi:hypothetical protein